MTTTSTAGTLRAARALIESPDAWRQDGQDCRMVRAEDAPGGWLELAPYCALGAISAACGGADRCLHDGYCDASGALADQARELIGPICGVASYNDDPSTTHADILALFDRAIAAQED